MLVRGIRGATTVEANDRAEILAATNELLLALIEANKVEREYVASVVFTTTPDLNAEFPAVAARAIGWTDVALMCGHEMSVPGSLQRVIRILMHVNTDLALGDVQHIYLRGASALRPDLVPGWTAEAKP